MIAVLIGLVFIVVGAWGLLHWSYDFITVIRGFGPISILIGGLIALISGIGSLRQTRSNDAPKE